MIAPEILIIDDETEITEIVSHLLTKAGHRCITASNADEAWELISEHQMPLIFCDISMPGRTGLELLSQLKMEGISCSVVMLTAYSDSDRIMEALRLGASDYITKPFDFEALIAKTPVWLELGNRFKRLGEELHESKIKRSIKMIDHFRVKSATASKRSS